MITSSAFARKRYAVLGLARSGLAAVRTLVRSGAQVTAWDNRDEPRQQVMAEFGDKVELADPVGADLAGFDGIVVSPGVPLNSHPIASEAAAVGVPVNTGDVTLFDPPTSRDSRAIDVVATVTNVRPACNDQGEKIYSVATFDVLARRRDAGPADLRGQEERGF